jgi:hypothetical protein
MSCQAAAVCRGRTRSGRRTAALRDPGHASFFAGVRPRTFGAENDSFDHQRTDHGTKLRKDVPPVYLSSPGFALSA